MTTEERENEKNRGTQTTPATANNNYNEETAHAVVSSLPRGPKASRFDVR